MSPDEPFDPNASPFAQTADRLVEAGFRAIPIMPRDKMPGELQGTLEAGRWTLMPAWNDYAKRAPAPAQIARWKTWPDANVGVVLGTPTGGYQLVAIDFDTDDADELELLQSQLPQSRMVKRGQRGYTAFYRAAKDRRTKRYMIEKDGRKRCVLEILTGNAPRQTVMPPSIHPFGRPYEYISHDAIVPIDQLPVLSAEHFEQLEDTLEHMGWNGADIQRRDVATTTDQATFDDDQNIWRNTNNVALEKMHLWVGDLGLPKLRRLPNGSWEAVPTWRQSNSGTPTMQRKANLKFHRTGIRDMGDDTGYTALDVVQAAFSWDFDECFRWLQTKLGMSDEASPDLPERRMGEQVSSQMALPIAVNDNFDEFPDHLTRLPGLLGDMVDYIVNTARRPNRTLALGAAIVCLGTIIGRRDATPTRAGTHMYVAALAPSGAGKDHPQVAGAEMLRIAAEGCPGIKLKGAPEYMSQTALIRDLEARQLFACFFDEFGLYLKRINHPKAAPHDAGVKKVILTAWGRGFMTMETPAWAGQPSQEIEWPAFSFLGSSVAGPFYEGLQGDDRENGFLNRMLLLPTQKRAKCVEPEHDFRDLPAALINDLQSAYRVRRSMGLDERQMHIVDWQDGDAKDLYSSFVDECESKSEDAAFFMRSADMATRLATILAVGRDIDFPVISSEDIAWGIAVARWSAHRMATDAGVLVADTPVARDRAKILQKLNDTPGRRREQSFFMKNMGFKSSELIPIVRDMIQLDLVRAEEVSPQRGGKPKRFLIAV